MLKKRLIAIILALVLIASLIAGVLPAVSAASNYTISLRDGSGNSSVTVEPGDTVTLYLKLSGNPGIISAAASVKLPSGLSLTAKPSSALSGADFEPSWQFSQTLTTNPYLIWMNVATGNDEGKLVTYNGNIRKLPIKVAENAVSGDYNITLTAPSDKNLTASTDGSGVIQPNTNKKINPSVSGFTVKVKGCEHSWGSWSQKTAPSCDKAGEEIRICSLCQVEEKRTVAATGHSFGSWSTTKKPNCTVAGEQKRTCQNPGCSKSETKAIQATGHKMTAWSQSKAPSCTAAGEEKRTCQNSGCTHAETREIKALGHNFTNPTVTKEPTCTKAGEKSGKCTRCNKETKDTIPATGHSYGSWKVTKEPTCTTTGVQTRTCTKCSQQETGKVKASGHQFSKPKITKKPTCTEPGSQTGKCVNCGKNATEEIPATGHKYGEFVVTQAATCTAPGVQTQTCEYCKGVVTQEILALDHEYAEGVVSQEATISNPGILQSKCTRCDTVQETQIPCGEQDAATGLVFEAQEGVFPQDTQLTVTQTAQENATDIVKAAVRKLSSRYVVYDIAAMANNVWLQPEGTLQVTIPVPGGFGTNLALYRVSETGEAAFVPGVLSKDGKSLSVELSELDCYVLCDLDAQPGFAANFEQLRPLLFGICGILFVCVVVFTILAITHRKKEEQTEI